MRGVIWRSLIHRALWEPHTCQTRLTSGLLQMDIQLNNIQKHQIILYCPFYTSLREYWFVLLATCILLMSFPWYYFCFALQGFNVYCCVITFSAGEIYLSFKLIISSQERGNRFGLSLESKVKLFQQFLLKKRSRKPRGIECRRMREWCRHLLHEFVTFIS